MLSLEILHGCYWKTIGNTQPDALERAVKSLREIAIDTGQACRVVDTGRFDNATGWHVVAAYLHTDGRIERHAEAEAEAQSTTPSATAEKGAQ